MITSEQNRRPILELSWIWGAATHIGTIHNHSLQYSLLASWVASWNSSLNATVNTSGRRSPRRRKSAPMRKPVYVVWNHSAGANWVSPGAVYNTVEPFKLTHARSNILAFALPRSL